jgi:hypothetical protein
VSVFRIDSPPGLMRSGGVLFLLFEFWGDWRAVYPPAEAALADDLARGLVWVGWFEFEAEVVVFYAVHWVTGRDG